MHKALAFLLLIVAQEAVANVSFGTFGPPISRVRSEKESTRSALSFRPFVGLFYKYPSMYPYVYDIELGYVFPESTYEDYENSKTKAVFGQINLNYYYNPFLFLIGGLSTVHTKIYGEGGTVTIGSRTYFNPTKEGQKSYNTIINLGAGFDFSHVYYGEFKAHIWEVLNSQSRVVSISLTLKYRIF